MRFVALLRAAPVPNDPAQIRSSASAGGATKDLEADGASCPL